MKIANLLTFFWIPTLALGGDYLTTQRPPLPIRPNQECSHGDATPVLRKGANTTSYERTLPKGHPKKVVESVELKSGEKVIFEQVGCEDMVGVITVALKEASRKEIIDRSLKALSSLEFEPEGFFMNRDTVRQITKAIESEKKTLGSDMAGFLSSTICLSRIDPDQKNSECITDVRIQSNDSGLNVRYIDRP